MTTQSRREFVKSIARAGAATGLAALGVLWAKRAAKAPACARSYQCGGCGVYNVCAIRPKAGPGHE